jgi:hypothetical protein
VTVKKTARFAPRGRVPLRPDWSHRNEFRRRINFVTGLEFGDRAATALEDLLDACRHYADPAAAGRQAPAFMTADWGNRTPPECLCAIVWLVEDIWHEQGGKGHGARWDVDDMQGPLVRLLMEMFKFAGVEKNSPSARTLRRALQAARADEDNSTT